MLMAIIAAGTTVASACILMGAAIAMKFLLIAMAM